MADPIVKPHYFTDLANAIVALNVQIQHARAVFGQVDGADIPVVATMAEAVNELVHLRGVLTDCAALERKTRRKART